MRTQATSTFLKQLEALPEKVREQVERFAFEELRKVESLAGLTNVKKLRGYRFSYRARFGDYRVGIELEDDTAVLKVVMHRRNVYRRFPG